MGRITAYDQNGHMVSDFDKSQYDLMHGWVGTEMERLRIENGKLRELVADMYMRFHGVVIENWAYSSEDFRMYEQRMRELGVEVDS